MKIKMAERHLRFIGSLPLCGTSLMQMTLLRTAAALGVLQKTKVPGSELKEDSYNYYELDDRKIFYLIFHDRNEADSMDESAQTFGLYCGGGLDIIESLVNDKDLERLGLDEILDLVDEYVTRMAEGKEGSH